MPEFTYTAVDQSGKRLKKTVYANSVAEIQAQLQQGNMFIVDVRQSAGRSKKHKGLSLADKVFFTQNVATLLESGMSLGEGLKVVADDTSNKDAVALYNAIRSDVGQGISFARSLSAHPESFDEVYISLVEAGENSGKLSIVLRDLAKNLEKDALTISQVKSAFMYPAFIMAVLIVLGLIIMIFVVPRIIPVFKELNAKLPITTVLLLDLSTFVLAHPLWTVAGIGAFIVGVVVFFRSHMGTIAYGYIITHTPLIKGIISNLDLSRISSTMALLIASGVPIQQAITISSATIKNPRLRRQFYGTSRKIATGRSFSEAFQDVDLPKTFIALVAVGERSGNIAGIFQTLATHYGEQLDTTVKNFVSLIEPFLTLIVGLVVGTVVISILYPIYQVIGNLQVGQ